MISLLRLKQAFSELDEIMADGAKNTHSQFSARQSYTEHRPPCNAMTMSKFRQLLGDDGMDELWAQLTNIAVEFKQTKLKEIACVGGGA